MSSRQHLSRRYLPLNEAKPANKRIPEPNEAAAVSSWLAIYERRMYCSYYCWLCLLSLNRLASVFQGIVGSKSPRDCLGEVRERTELASVGSAIGVKRGEGREGGCVA